jgi:hypothetical protein
MTNATVDTDVGVSSTAVDESSDLTGGPVSPWDWDIAGTEALVGRTDDGQLDYWDFSQFQGAIDYSFTDLLAPQTGYALPSLRDPDGAGLPLPTFHIRILAPGFDEDRSSAADPFDLAARRDGAGQVARLGTWLLIGTALSLLLVWRTRRYQSLRLALLGSVAAIVVAILLTPAFAQAELWNEGIANWGWLANLTADGPTAGDAAKIGTGQVRGLLLDPDPLTFSSSAGMLTASKLLIGDPEPTLGPVKGTLTIQNEAVAKSTSRTNVGPVSGSVSNGSAFGWGSAGPPYVSNVGFGMLGTIGDSRTHANGLGQIGLQAGVGTGTMFQSPGAKGSITGGSGSSWIGGPSGDDENLNPNGNSNSFTSADVSHPGVKGRARGSNGNVDDGAGNTNDVPSTIKDGGELTPGSIVAGPDDKLIPAPVAPSFGQLDGNGLGPQTDDGLKPVLVLTPGFDDVTPITQLPLTSLNDGISTSATPEPGTWLLIGTGLTLLLISRMQAGQIRRASRSWIRPPRADGSR